MKLVSNNSDISVDRGRAERQLRHALRELAANLLRIMRGAGRHDKLGEMLAAALDALEGYRSAFGCGPDPLMMHETFDLEAVFAQYRPWTKDISEEQRERWTLDGTFARQRAEIAIVHGAMQFAASRLLDQMAQAAAGEKQMHFGIEQRAEAKRVNRRPYL